MVFEAKFLEWLDGNGIVCQGCCLAPFCMGAFDCGAETTFRVAKALCSLVPVCIDALFRIVRQLRSLQKGLCLLSVNFLSLQATFWCVTMSTVFVSGSIAGCFG